MSSLNGSASDEIVFVVARVAVVRVVVVIVVDAIVVAMIGVVVLVARLVLWFLLLD